MKKYFTEIACLIMGALALGLVISCLTFPLILSGVCGSCWHLLWYIASLLLLPLVGKFVEWVTDIYYNNH